MRVTIIFAVAAAMLAAVGPAAAIDFFELEVYPATTEGKGLHELESLNSYVANGRAPTDEELAGEDTRRHRLFRTSLEYNYGLTDKIDVAAYVNLQHENGDEFEYAGSKLRLRGGLWDKGRYPVDIGWYVEAEMPRFDESDLEFEFRPIISRDFGPLSLDLNPIFELPTVTTERRTLEFDYAARLYYRLSRDFQPGVEFYGGAGQIRRPDPSREQEHYVVPSIYGRIMPGLKFAFGPAFGITRASDPVIIRLNVEYEFTFPFGGGVASPANTPVTY
jgi:hypothetical protein